jgi:hypothetical protein
VATGVTGRILTLRKEGILPMFAITSTAGTGAYLT